MKIYTDPQFTEDISKYTDEELAQCGVYNRECASKPIKLKNVDLYKNEKGQLTVRFETVNHKYLNVRYSTISSRRIEDDGKKLWSSSIEIETLEKYPFKDEKTGETLFNSSVSQLTLWLEPDTEEEEDMLSGVMAVLPLKWEYSLVLIPYADMESAAPEGEPIKELEEENIYEFTEL